MLRRRSTLKLLAAAVPAAIAPAWAQPRYPTGPIRIVIPTPPGGGLDTMARLFGTHLGATFGQPVVVESRPGGNTAIAAQAVASAPPDGQTLLLTFTSTQLNTIIQPKPTYRMADLAPIAMTIASPIAFAVNAQVPATTLREFVALVKSKPRTYSYGSYGAGSVANFMGEALNEKHGLDLLHVAYRGGAPALLDLIAGQIQSAFNDVGSLSREAAATGRIRVLGVTGAQRFKPFPDVPTFREQGMPELDFPAWHGLFAPAGTPAATVAALEREMVRIIHLPEISARLYELGFEPMGVNAAKFQQYIQQSAQPIEALFRSGRIKLE